MFLFHFNNPGKICAKSLEYHHHLNLILKVPVLWYRYCNTESRFGGKACGRANIGLKVKGRESYRCTGIEIVTALTVIKKACSMMAFVYKVGNLGIRERYRYQCNSAGKRTGTGRCAEC